MKLNFSPIITVFLVISIFMLIITSQSHADLVLPYSANIDNQSSNPAFRIINSGHGTTISGYCEEGTGVMGTHGNGNIGALGGPQTAVWGRSEAGTGVHAITTSGVAVFGTNNQNKNHGWLGTKTAGVRGESATGYAGDFVGKVRVKVLEITGGSDLSEQFSITTVNKRLEPIAGMVVSIDPDNPGGLMVSNKAYDRKVAGIISGAGGVKPGMLMGQEGTSADGNNPVALSGRVYCMTDASTGAIEPGDLLTTSHTPGHAMKVTDYDNAQGAILGKAMTSLDKGKGLVLVLVTLQ